MLQTAACILHICDGIRHVGALLLLSSDAVLTQKFDLNWIAKRIYGN